MMLSYVSGNQHLQKTKKHYYTLSKKIDNMKLWSLLALNGRSLSSEEAEKPPPQAGCSVLNSRRGHNEDMLSKSEILHARHYC